MEDQSYEEIKHNDKLVAIILRTHYTSEKTAFFSSDDFSQQLGYIVYKKDGVIDAHSHKEVHRKITLTQEVLFIKKGRLAVNLYAPDKEYITSRELNAGDIIFLCSGGHGFKMLEDTEMVEVKQGPYSGKESDKELFEGIENDSGK
jgi:quercetin dioxygenase-like cupin family protein